MQQSHQTSWLDLDLGRADADQQRDAVATVSMPEETKLSVGMQPPSARAPARFTMLSLFCCCGCQWRLLLTYAWQAMAALPAADALTSDTCWSLGIMSQLQS